MLLNFGANTSTFNLISEYIGYFFISFLYNSAIYRKIIFSIIFKTLTVLMEIFTINLYSFYTGINLNTLLKNNYLIFSMYALVCFILFVVIKLYSAIYKKPTVNSIHMSKITLTQLFAVPLLSAIILYMAIVTVEYNLNYSSLIVTMSIFLINIVFFNFYEKINEAADKKSEMISLNNQIKYYTTLYYNLNKERDNALELKHNIKNSLINIKSFLVRQNNLKAIEEIDYILGNTCQEDIYICEVPIIDAMVNFKNQQAKELGINMEVSTSLNVKINISNSDLANILGNALDNAIEACSKNTNESNKVIKLQIEQRNNSLYIRISNPYEKEIKLKNNFPLSSKRKNEYGIGIRTIQKIVRNKNSIMNINLDNKIFELEIIIFSAIK